jgi:integrase
MCDVLLQRLQHPARDLDRPRTGPDRSPARARERRAELATLAFTGLRLGELLELRWRDVDLASGRLSVRESKADAGQRTQVS